MRNVTLIKSSRMVVSAARVINRVFFGGVVLLLVLSWIFSGRFAGWLVHPGVGSNIPSITTGLRLVMLLGLVMAVATEILLTALKQIITSAEQGDPFIGLNAGRLRTIGWSLLALQLMDVPGALIEKFFPNLGTGGPDVSFSPGGWIAVLMVFVLSRVFQAGAAMRDDLEGTV